MRAIDIIPGLTVLALCGLAHGSIEDRTADGTRDPVAVLDRNTSRDFDFDLPGLHTLGSREALIVLIEFSDYQCVQCAIFHEIIFSKIKTNFIDTGKVFYVAVNNPQPTHPVAALAAAVSYCAADQGRYREMRNALFADSLYLDEDTIFGLVHDLGLHPAEVRDCLESGIHSAQLTAEKRCSERLGMKITPSFILGSRKGGRAIDGERIDGAPLWSEFKEILNDRLMEVAAASPPE